MPASSIESRLTRELDIRFIDARSITTEARVSLGIQGYPSPHQLSEVREEAVRIFRSKSDKEQQVLQKLFMDLEAVKIPAGSMSSKKTSSSTSSSEDLESLTSDEGTNKPNRRNRMMSGIFRR